jgi:hypothetical protein
MKLSRAELVVYFFEVVVVLGGRWATLCVGAKHPRIRTLQRCLEMFFFLQLLPALSLCRALHKTSVLAPIVVVVCSKGSSQACLLHFLLSQLVQLHGDNAFPTEGRALVYFIVNISVSGNSTSELFVALTNVNGVRPLVRRQTTRPYMLVVDDAVAVTCSAHFRGSLSPL